MYCRDQEIGDGERGPIGSPEKRAKLSDALEHYKKMESAWKEANQEIASMCMRRDILSHAPGPEVHDDRVPEPLCPETGVLKPECRGSPGEGSSRGAAPQKWTRMASGRPPASMARQGGSSACSGSSETAGEHPTEPGGGLAGAPLVCRGTCPCHGLEAMFIRPARDAVRCQCPQCGDIRGTCRRWVVPPATHCANCGGVGHVGHSCRCGTSCVANPCHGFEGTRPGEFIRPVPNAMHCQCTLCGGTWEDGGSWRMQCRRWVVPPATHCANCLTPPARKTRRDDSQGEKD